MQRRSLKVISLGGGCEVKRSLWGVRGRGKEERYNGLGMGNDGRGSRIEGVCVQRRSLKVISLGGG